MLAKAKDYFACPTLTGVPLETNGDAGSKGSHWERGVLQDEIMTASNVIGQAAYSIFTLAILDDSNWYSSVDYSYANYIGWGKGKGCDFVTKGCTSTTKFSEFCT